MIDFHSHILPAMDDGSGSLAESLALLRESQRQGVRVMVATPHFYAHQNAPPTFLQRRELAWEVLRPALEPDMPEILLGAEVAYFEGICGVKDLPALCTQGTGLLLLEMPFCSWNRRICAELAQLCGQPRLTVLLAHIERYLFMQRQETLEELLRQGVLFQSNAGFFLGRRTRKQAMQMLQNHEIHVLGSDCHNMGRRPPRLGEAAKAIAARLGSEALEQLEFRGRQYLMETEVGAP